jgi:hypothetical protein
VSRRSVFATRAAGFSSVALAFACSASEPAVSGSERASALVVERVSALADPEQRRETIGAPPPAVPSAVPAAPAAESLALVVPPAAVDVAPEPAATAEPVSAPPTPDSSDLAGAAAQPELLATARETIVFAEPSRRSEKLGYLRLGARVRRSVDAVGFEGCPSGWYRIAPQGFVCSGAAASVEAGQPLAELTKQRPDRDAELPYAYGRSKPLTPPLYPRLPSKAEALALEGAAPQRALGWDDIESGALPEPFASGAGLPTPFGFARPAEPLRALVKSGFALIGVFEHEKRRFGMTTDLELVPLDRLTRVEAGGFRGLALDEQTALPVVFVRSRRALLYAGGPTTGFTIVRSLGFREAVPVTGKPERIGGLAFQRTADGHWLRDENLLRVDAPERLPPWASGDKTWIHVAIGAQTLIAYAGARPTYVTLVSTGADGLADPKQSHATPRGEFLIHTKHVTATMNGDEVGDEYDLRDVQYVQYFTEGYALHAAYWHDAFGTAHSHGCVNLSPQDARWLFQFTAPAVPRGWHGAYSRRGTLLSVTP